MNKRPIFFTVICIFATCFAYSQSETMVTGKIVDSAGANLSGCRVHVVGCEKQDSSDLQGVYRIYLAPGKYELQVFRAGMLTRRQRVDIPKDDFYEVDFVLAKND